MAMTALDYEEIRQLLARYSHGLDFTDIRAFGECFAPDAVFSEKGLPPASPGGAPTEMRFEGRASIVEFAAGFTARAGGHLRHWSSPPVIEGDGRSATGTSFLMVLRPGAAPGSGVILTGVYHDTYTKTDGKWYFAHREFTADPGPGDAPESGDPLVARFDAFVAGLIRQGADR
ncbi:hypothetical protein GCM10011583_24220 [Streptomyces camponoticapitis]|uniref:SnoaL-like domain-containing protein n=1 Tax=Streptomyces camponoticapitis TaxID=1616125 RepID=A0ABQ2E384_9ACTN|nr:nuclear transport factor 2 family protein [Streptomyces camponoticapitis]GGJ91893.1 hypothetical protein GCM10011583_24220 [Streptomyces camponoticapitis]